MGERRSNKTNFLWRPGPSTGMVAGRENTCFGIDRPVSRALGCGIPVRQTGANSAHEFSAKRRMVARRPNASFWLG